MAIYTFADREAPTAKLIDGILSFLRIMITNERAYIVQHPRLSQKDQAYSRGKIHAWQEAIDVISDSSSV